jgi:hypothetical protein
MKYFSHIINKSFFAILGMVVFSACTKKETELNTSLAPVQSLYAPADGLFVKLQPATSASVQFEWDAARAQDGTYIQYELAFDKEDGDFSQPIYKIASDGNGAMNTLTLSHKVLNKIANMAGIAALETGTLKWTVLSIKGINSVKAETVRTMIVERPAGFADIPADVYLTGDATEAGADLSAAIKLKTISPGVFEIFTKLKPGTFSFTNQNTGTPLTFALNGTTLVEGSPMTQTEEKLYRIRLDFNNAAAEMTEIVSLGVYVSAYAEVKHPLSYTGNGVWENPNTLVEFFPFSWGRDERFKFLLKTKDSQGATVDEYYGSMNQSNPVPPDANTPADYFTLVPVDNSQWDYTYKFPTAADNQMVKIIADFSPSSPTYSYQVVIN